MLNCQNHIACPEPCNLRFRRLPPLCRITADICSPRPRSVSTHWLCVMIREFSMLVNSPICSDMYIERPLPGRSSYPSSNDVKALDGELLPCRYTPGSAGTQSLLRVREAAYPGGVGDLSVGRCRR